MNTELRYELKFILDDIELTRAMKWLYKYTSAQERYHKRKVNSLYFDDLDFTSVKDNLVGLPYRSKNRLRWYGEERNILPFFEIKKREGRLGSKEKYSLNSLNSNLLDLKIEDIALACLKDLKPHNVIFDKYLFPSIQVSYEREYFETLGGLRITFDKNINYFDTMPYHTLRECNAVPYQLNIMEIKFEPRLKNEVVQLIRPLNMTPKRHSKYLVGLSKLGRTVYM